MTPQTYDLYSGRLKEWKRYVRVRYEETQRIAGTTKLPTSQPENSSVNDGTNVDHGIKSIEAQDTEEDQDAAQSVETKTDDAGDRSVVQLGPPGLHQMSAVLKGDTMERIIIPTGSEAKPNLVLQPSSFTPVNIPVAKSSTSVGTNHDESADIPATDLSVTKTSTSAGSDHDGPKESPVKKRRHTRLQGDLEDPDFFLRRQIQWLQWIENDWETKLDDEWIELGLPTDARQMNVVSDKLPEVKKPSR